MMPFTAFLCDVDVVKKDCRLTLSKGHGIVLTHPLCPNRVHSALLNDSVAILACGCVKKQTTFSKMVSIVPKKVHEGSYILVLKYSENRGQFSI